MGSHYYLDFTPPHSEKDILPRVFFGLYRLFKQLLGTWWNYKAVYNAEILPEHTYLLDKEGYF